MSQRLLLLALLVLAPLAQAAPRIGVATMLPGEIFWERFGHDSIVVDDPAAGAPISYNFGFFDLSEPGFVGRFVRGEMEYQLVALPFAEDLVYYRDTGRGVSIQWLDLSDAEANRLAVALAENAKPENARYRYDYFTDNCATRVRDALDRALGGELRRQMETRSQGNSYRSEAVRLASPADWMWLGFDVGLGPFADVTRSRWEDAFVPMRLADALRDVRRADDRPLVRSEQVLLPHRIAPEPRPEPQRWWPWLLAGIGVAAVLLLLGRAGPRSTLWVALPAWTLCGVLGLVMAFLWCCTAHRAGWANHNLLLFNPLCLLLWPGAVRMLRRREPGRLFRSLLLAILAGAMLALFLLWLPLQPQRNAPWIGLMLPAHAALWWLYARAGLVRQAATAQDARHA
ncbi:DUF4105 domain-containing protein [Lysobacter sp. M2-1]|uniref:lipoprotein N-acyltransferase Lnb domain-containing protein n=1 Tax=Lysobacter sp. M2-1 TaxID=2916839 RepID=UPI001F57C041|nr:DUF4105 domain-containing protein [Lysobacter sp. M2-1]